MSQSERRQHHQRRSALGETLLRSTARCVISSGHCIARVEVDTCKRRTVSVALLHAAFSLIVRVSLLQHPVPQTIAVPSQRFQNPPLLCFLLRAVVVGRKIRFPSCSAVWLQGALSAA
eukprot:1487599-Rhodomonas_salina.1